jgi:hypothetical protein
MKNIGGLSFIKREVWKEYMDFNIRNWSELHDTATKQVVEAAEEKEKEEAASKAKE